MVALTRPKTLFVLFFLSFFFFSTLDASSRDELLQEDQPVEISADIITHDRESNILHAAGHVTVVQGAVTISADSMVFDRDKGVITADGHIEGSDEGGNLLSGDRLTFDVNRSTSVIVNGRLFFKGENVYLTGDEIRKTGRETYEIDRGTFTTCDCDREANPAWSVYTLRAPM